MAIKDTLKSWFGKAKEAATNFKEKMQAKALNFWYGDPDDPEDKGFRDTWLGKKIAGGVGGIRVYVSGGSSDKKSKAKKGSETVTTVTAVEGSEKNKPKDSDDDEKNTKKSKKETEKELAKLVAEEKADDLEDEKAMEDKTKVEYKSGEEKGIIVRSLLQQSEIRGEFITSKNSAHFEFVESDVSGVKKASSMDTTKRQEVAETIHKIENQAYADTAKKLGFEHKQITQADGSIKHTITKDGKELSPEQLRQFREENVKDFNKVAEKECANKDFSITRTLRVQPQETFQQQQQAQAAANASKASNTPAPPPSNTPSPSK